MLDDPSPSRVDKASAAYDIPRETTDLTENPEIRTCKASLIQNVWNGRRLRSTLFQASSLPHYPQTYRSYSLYRSFLLSLSTLPTSLKLAMSSRDLEDVEKESEADDAIVSAALGRKDVLEVRRSVLLTSYMSTPDIHQRKWGFWSILGFALTNLCSWEFATP